VRGMRVDDVRAFRTRVAPLLAADEVRHSVPLGVLAAIEHDPGRYAAHHLWLADDGGTVAACAFMTPPFRLLPMGGPAGFDELIDAIRSDGVPIPGVSGFLPEVEQFAERWTAITGESARVDMSMRVYTAAAVVQPTAAPGRMRAATDADRALLTEWAHAFAAETMLSEGPEEIARSVVGRIGADPGIVIWEDGGIPVTLAGAVQSSPGIARVGPVYTPPEHRRRGYATSLVAEWTAELLRRGTERCMLFTDLANPTSNSIYQAVGYRPVGESRLIDFL
jgi:uncharacterized protein